jgi:hypothetical protein
MSPASTMLMRGAAIVRSLRRLNPSKPPEKAAKMRGRGLTGINEVQYDSLDSSEPPRRDSNTRRGFFA